MNLGLFYLLKMLLMRSHPFSTDAKSFGGFGFEATLRPPAEEHRVS
jgi:hypothetical protein